MPELKNLPQSFYLHLVWEIKAKRVSNSLALNARIGSVKCGPLCNQCYTYPRNLVKKKMNYCHHFKRQRTKSMSRMVRELLQHIPLSQTYYRLCKELLVYWQGHSLIFMKKILQIQCLQIQLQIHFANSVLQPVMIMPTFF